MILILNWTKFYAFWFLCWKKGVNLILSLMTLLVERSHSPAGQHEGKRNRQSSVSNSVRRRAGPRPHKRREGGGNNRALCASARGKWRRDDGGRDRDRDRNRPLVFEVFISQGSLIEIDAPTRVCGDIHGQASEDVNCRRRHSTRRGFSTAISFASSTAAASRRPATICFLVCKRAAFWYFVDAFAAVLGDYIDR